MCYEASTLSMMESLEVRKLKRAKMSLFCKRQVIPYVRQDFRSRMNTSLTMSEFFSLSF